MKKNHVSSGKNVTNLPESECVYPNWDGAFWRGKHKYDRDGFCIICGYKRNQKTTQ